jgi:hypothetical protein
MRLGSAISMGSQEGCIVTSPLTHPDIEQLLS